MRSPERSNQIKNLPPEQKTEAEKIINLLNPQNRTTFQKFQGLEQTRSEAEKLALKFARQQLASGEEPNALYGRPGELEMYEWHTSFDINKFLCDNIKGKSLDIGSGGKNELQGILPDEQIVYVDIDRYKQKNFVQADASQLPFRNDTFDSIYASAVTNDYQTTKDLLPEMLRVIKPRGVIILRPHGNSDEIMENLVAVKEVVVDIERQCELILYESYRKHKEFPIIIDQSQIFIIVRPE